MEEAAQWLLRVSMLFQPAYTLVSCIPLKRAGAVLRLKDILLLNATWPSEWIGRYFLERLDQQDPVMQVVLRTGRSLLWNSSLGNALSPKAIEFFGQAKQYGIEAGAVSTFFSVDGWINIMAVAGPAGCRYEDWLPAMVWLIHCANLSSLAKTQARMLPFTDQQIRILHGLQMGKSHKEIADSLNVSVATVYQYLMQLRKKTGLRREEAVWTLRQWQPLSILPDFQGARRFAKKGGDPVLKTESPRQL